MQINQAYHPFELETGRMKSTEQVAEQLEQAFRCLGSVITEAKLPEHPFTGLPPERLTLIEQVAHEAAHLFQRSSSCVEGHNGQLALHRHHLHRISSRRLAALTTVHNYFIQRPDGTTPAERLFDQVPSDLFEWLLGRVPIPARPARKRSSAPAKPLFQAAA